jgi:glycylpeptide N-tetradecanoyltransferase
MNFAKDTHSHKVTDFFSFYSLPSTVINNPKHAVIEAAYLFYYASEVAFEEGVEENGVLKKRLERLIGDALIIAQQAEFDVFNALTLMDTVPVLRDLKVHFLFLAWIVPAKQYQFGPGDGYLNFYLYNWRTAPMAGMEAIDHVPAGKGVGVVML